MGKEYLVTAIVLNYEAEANNFNFLKVFLFQRPIWGLTLWIGEPKYWHSLIFFEKNASEIYIKSAKRLETELAIFVVYLRQVSSKNAMRDTRQARKYILVRLGMLQKCFQKILAKKVWILP